MNVAVVGNYMPRQCGLATFTTDVTTWVARALGEGSQVFVVAMDDKPEGYDYPPMVRFEVVANHPRDYHRAADFINLSGVDLVCLQHEFGIFGGPFGVFITDMMRDIKKPIVTTLHTVLPDPLPERREALVQVAAYSDALIVMSRKSVEFLEAYYGVEPEKVHLIHHGVPDMPFTDPNEHKARWGLQGRTVLLNFGLLSERKGIEYMIEAMPAIVERFPDAVFVVLGATHPPVKKREGEKYRFFLKRLAHDLGVEDNVEFYDRFVTLEELTEFLAACDIYVTPYLDRGQIVSGTLAYAMGLGKPVVSTPYYYAEELLGDGRGVLAEFRDPDSLARGVIELLENPRRMQEMREKAYALGRKMTWKVVGNEYVELFQSVLAGRRLAPVTMPERKRQPISIRDLPRPKLDYLVRLTDSTGILHGAHFDIPDRASGYTTEDNALALAAAVICHLQIDDARSLELARTYLGFLRYMQLPDGRFHNFLSYDMSFADEVGGDECQGRALAGLGVTVALEPNEGLASFAKSMFDEALHSIVLSEPRAIAYAIIGSYHYLTRFRGASLVYGFLEDLSKMILEAYEREAAPGWRWFEDTLYAGNGLIPRALLLAYRATRDERFRDIGLTSLKFVTDLCYREGYFDFIGDQGWLPRGGERARFRQLPIEAAALTEACVDAYVIEVDGRYLELARAALEWFLGRNAIKEPIYEFASGSCADALLAHGVDSDRGAEATIQFLLALLRLTTAIHLEPTELRGASLGPGSEAVVSPGDPGIN
jgi:glycosyltransferase involved in cell wall biosynthesis